MTGNEASRSIVFCRDIHWDDVIRTNTHSMAAQFVAHGWRCGWISRLMTPWRAFYRRFGTARQIWRRGGIHHNGVFEYSPLFLAAYGTAPVMRSRLIWRVSPWMTVPAISHPLARAGLDAPYVCWIGSLSMGAIAGRLRAEKVVYQAHDAFSRYPGAPSTTLTIESEMVHRAAVVLSTSVSTQLLLRELYPDCADRIHVVPHGVHLEQYTGNMGEPQDLRPIPHPRAILVGTLDLEDEDLLAYAARSLPQVSFVLIGPGGDRIAKAAGSHDIRNIYMLGARPQAQLPGYLCHCDLGLIAYPLHLRESRLFGTNPMKRYEYAAAGLPTVSVDLREYALSPSPLLFPASTPRAFVEAIEAALSTTGESKDSLLAFARASTWERRYWQVLNTLGISGNRSGGS